MLVLKLCEQFCPEKIPYKLGSKLGDGADGEVFEIDGQPDKVIKFGVIFQRDSLMESKYEIINRVLDQLIQEPNSIFASVYSQKYMGQFARKALDFNQNWIQQPYILYYYIMEKMFPISEDERKIFWSLVSHNDSGIEKNIPIQKMKQMILEMQGTLDFDAERVIFFCENYRNNKVKHLDIHVRNIMKDSQGNFKLIDFDRSEIRKENES